MPIPSNASMTLDEQFRTLREVAGRLKATASALRSKISDTVQPLEVLRTRQQVKIALAQLAALSVIPGLLEYGNSQIGKGITYDDLPATVSAAGAILEWADENLPKKGTKIVESIVYTVAEDGSFSQANDTVVVKTGELASLLDALIALIE